MNLFSFAGTGFVEMMRNGTRCWRKQGAQLSSASRGAVPSLATVFGWCRNVLVTMSYSRQWQEEEVGWGKRCSKQWSSPARETKEEGNATWQIQEEQGQARQIWKETVNGAALIGQCVRAQKAASSVFCRTFEYQESFFLFFILLLKYTNVSTLCHHKFVTFMLSTRCTDTV